MNSSTQKDYPLLSNLSEADLDDNSSLKKMLQLVGENKRVVDFGCATGYFARFLTNKGCKVTGVEVNSQAAKSAEQYCEQVIVADLDFVSLAGILPEQTFDVAVFGDVLEHLRNPWRVLNETRKLLKPEGYVVVSIPNIAHGAIRLALLQGDFEYMELGILDNTHLRFFTRKTVETLFERCEYFVESVERTKLPIFSGSNWIPNIEKNKFDSKIIQEIEQDEDADTLQFVIRAFPLSLEGKYAALNEKYLKLVEEVKSSHTQLKQNRVELEQSHIQLQEKKNELEQSQNQVQQKQAEVERYQVEIKEKETCFDLVQAQLQQTQAELEQAHFLRHQTQEEQLEQAHFLRHQTQEELDLAQAQLQQTQAELEQAHFLRHQTQGELERSLSQLQQIQLEWQETQTKLQQAHQAWEYCQVIIKAMESSKFWQLRLAWFRLKRFVGIKGD